MKRPIAIVAGALCALLMSSMASAQAAGVTVVVPAGPSGAIQATVSGVACGAAGAVSPSASTTLTLPVTCATPNAVVGFNSNGVGLASTVTVPATGTGTLVLSSLNPANLVTITIPAVPGGSGTVNALVSGQVCGTATVSSTNSSTISLPATCATPGALVAFSTPGGGLTQTVNVPATGGGTLTLAALTATSPVNVTLPAGSGVITVRVNGQACGTATLVAGTTTTMSLPATCAASSGTVTFTNAAGQQLAAVPSISATGGGNLTVATLDPAVVRVTLPAAPGGNINILSGSTVCGTAAVSAAGPTTVTLSPLCSVAGAPLSFTGGSNVAIASTLSVPATITTTNGTLTLPAITAVTPLTVQLPAGTGNVTTLVGNLTCATSTLSSTGTTTVTIPVTCSLAGQTITFTLNGAPVVPTLTVPASASGSLVLASLAQAVPAPAKTGNAGLDGSGTSTWIFVGLLAAVMTAVVGGRVVGRRE